jgi:hypothetical protein
MRPFYDRDGNHISQEEWSLKFSDLSYKHIAITPVGEDTEVSTVWMGIDHNFFGEGPPLIFETQIFGGDLDGYIWRWPNIDAARAGHDQVVAQVQEGVGI